MIVFETWNPTSPVGVSGLDGAPGCQSKSRFSFSNLITSGERFTSPLSPLPGLWPNLYRVADGYFFASQICVSPRRDAKNGGTLFNSASSFCSSIIRKFVFRGGSNFGVSDFGVFFLVSSKRNVTFSKK